MKSDFFRRDVARMRGSCARLVAATLLTIVSFAGVSAELPEVASGAAEGWAVSGFGTLGLAYHTERDTQFRRSFDQGEGARAGRLDAGVDSLFGLQLNRRLGEDWSAMVQVVARKDAVGDWAPKLSWGFVKYVPDNWMEIRVGRLTTDIYLDGDSRHIGYAYAGVRPIPDIYGRLAFDTFDGVDASFFSPLGSGMLKFKLYGGRTRGESYVHDHVYRFDHGRTLGSTLEWLSPEWTLRLAWGRMQNPHDHSLDPFRGVLRAASDALGPVLGAQLAARAGEIDTRSEITFTGFGVGWDRGPVSLQLVGAEFAYNSFPDFEGWALGVTAAYRLGAWKPYVSYSKSVLAGDRRPLALPPGLERLQSTYDNINRRLDQDQYAVGVGVRYDVTENAALKLQLDQIRAKRSSMLLDGEGMAVGPRSFSVMSVALDFVF